MPGLTVLAVAAAAPLVLAAEPGEEALRGVIAAYRDAPAVVDTMTYEVRLPGADPERGSGRVVLAGEGASFVANGLLLMARGDAFYVADEHPAGPYVKIDRGERFVGDLARVLGGALNIPTPPHMFAREDAAPDEFVTAFGFGILQGLELESHGDAEVDGAVRDRLGFRADNGTLSLYVDPKTSFVTRADLTARPPGADGALEAVLRFSPEVVEDGPGLLALDEGARREVSSVREFIRAGPEVGMRTPDLRFVGPDGDEWRLSDRGGRLVVLEFWASWCGGCLVSLPAFDRVADWAEAEGVAADFFAVNSRETQTPARMRETAATWWSQMKVDVGWVVDPGDAAADALDITSFPTLVVIAPGGEVVYTHSGYSPELERDLKEAIRTHAP